MNCYSKIYITWWVSKWVSESQEICFPGVSVVVEDRQRWLKQEQFQTEKERSRGDTLPVPGSSLKSVSSSPPFFLLAGTAFASILLLRRLSWQSGQPISWSLVSVSLPRVFSPNDPSTSSGIIDKPYSYVHRSKEPCTPWMCNLKALMGGLKQIWVDIICLLYSKWSHGVNEKYKRNKTCTMRICNNLFADIYFSWDHCPCMSFPTVCSFPCVSEPPSLRPHPLTSWVYAPHPNVLRL